MTMKVYEAIADVTRALSREGISKDRKNESQGYRFRGIDDVYNALAPLLAASKLCILPNVLSREVVERASPKGTALFYVTVRVNFAFVSAEDGSKHEVITYGEAMDTGDKATNKAMSAAYKYAAMQAFCIPTEGDNDADSTTHEVKPITGQQINADEYEALDTDTRAMVDDLAGRVSQLLFRNDVAGAHAELEVAKLGQEEKMALWSRLDSKQRSALKKHAESLKKAA